MPKINKQDIQKTIDRVADCLVHRPQLKARLPFVLMLAVLFLALWFFFHMLIMAFAAVLLGAAILWRNPSFAERFGAGVTQRLITSLSTNGGRFAWGLAFWVYALLFVSSWLAILVGFVALITEPKHCIEFLKEAFKNEWPYNFLAALGAVFLYFLAGWASIASNFVITTITGFHASYFPNSGILFSSIFILFSFFSCVHSHFGSRRTYDRLFKRHNEARAARSCHGEHTSVVRDCDQLARFGRSDGGGRGRDRRIRFQR